MIRRTPADLMGDLTAPGPDVTRLLQEWRGGSRAALEQLTPLVYDELHAMASRHMAREWRVSIYQTTALVSRYRPLREANAISEQEFVNAQAGQAQAEADVAAARAAIQTAQLNVGYATVTAPIAGRIGRALVTEGALVSQAEATQLALIQQTNPVYVNSTQSVAELRRLRQALASGRATAATTVPVRIVLDDGTELARSGRLLFSDVTVDPATGSVTLRAVFDNPDGLLLPGMFVRARIVKGTVSEGILVPQPAVVLDPKGGASVMIAGPDNKAQKRDIQLGEMIGKEWRVVSGLKPGDKVIVEGAANVKDKGPIKPRAVTPGAAAEK